MWETSDEIKIEARQKAHEVFDHDRDRDMVVDGHFILCPEDVARFDALVLIDADTGIISRLKHEEIEQEKEVMRKRIEMIESGVFARIVNDGIKEELSI